MRAIFADPKVDFIFKKIFGDENHPERLISLLNPLLELDEAHRIVEIEILSPEQRPIVEDLKLSVLDVKCQDAQGTQYVVEMQLINVPGFEKRVVYNVSKAYVQQLKSGENYPKLNDVVGITICEFDLFGPKVPLLSRWLMQEQHSGEKGLLQLQYVFLELTKYQAGENPQTEIEKWAYFFKETSQLEKIPTPLKELPYQQALEAAKTAKLSPEEWEYYDKIQVARQDAKGALEFAQTTGFEQGRQEGKKEGRREGRQEGRREGLVETIIDLCEVFQITWNKERKDFTESCSEVQLQELKKSLKQQKSWPYTKIDRS